MLKVPVQRMLYVQREKNEKTRKSFEISSNSGLEYRQNMDSDVIRPADLESDLRFPIQVDRGPEKSKIRVRPVSAVLGQC